MEQMEKTSEVVEKRRTIITRILREAKKEIDNYQEEGLVQGSNPKLLEGEA